MGDDGRAVLSVHISGRVQGVGFRVWTQDEARRLGLDGWVRNESDGSVRALVAGPPSVVSEFIDRLHAGPPGSKVTRVETTPSPDEDVASGFRISK